MARPPERKTRISQFAGRSLARLIRAVFRTSKVVYDPPDMMQQLEGLHPAIVVMWHGQFMMLPYIHAPTTPTAIMVARHGDAEVIGEALTSFGLTLIRGAGAGSRQRDRGGSQALREALRVLASGKSVGITADVPPGPARRAGTGVVALARLSGRPVIAVAAATSRFKALDTWSRMTINLPFSTLAFTFETPIAVPHSLDERGLEVYRQKIESALDTATQRAYAMAGADIARATPVSSDPDGPPAVPGAALKSYRAATRLMRPAVPLLLKLRERQGKEDPKRRGERLGEASAARPLGPLAWFHAASIGETNAVLPVIESLSAQRPDLNFLLTTGTVTSAALAGRRLGPRTIHQYVPLDAPGYAERFLDHWQPDLAVFTESEVWPNLVLATAGRGIPLALVNGRISNRSYRRWRRRLSIARPLFGRFAVVLAQNETLARRFAALGAGRVIAAGNLKADAPPPKADPLAFEQLRQALGRRARFVAASTHDGEELAVAEAHRLVAQTIEGFCTIIAPRHPERGTALAERLKSLGLNVAQRSLGALPSNRTDIYIADTLGEFGTLYALSPIAFIGGSLVDKGGQNPIEAIHHGAAVLTGPYTQNFRDSYRALVRQNAAIEVRSAEELASSVARLTTDPAALARMQAGANAALTTLSGALAKTVDALVAHLPARQELERVQP